MNATLPRWLSDIHQETILPRRAQIQSHPFVLAMKSGTATDAEAERYFSGLFWHLLDFGKHVEHLMKKRPAEVADRLAGRAEDKDGDTDILGRIVDRFGGPRRQIEKSPWAYRPHPNWVQHDALLRAAIYSTDLPWQVGTAALNVGIESLVPWMIGPLFAACRERYGLDSNQAEWLESRSGEAEIQHGENGFIILSQFVSESDHTLQEQCRFYVDALSQSMAERLLATGVSV